MAVNTLTESLDSLWTSTWPTFKPGVIDQIFLKKYPFYWWLSQKGHIQYYPGGRDIRYPLEVDVNPTVVEIGKSGEVDLTDVDPFTTVIYPWSTLAGNINRYREDDRMNRGKAAVFNLMEGKRKNLIKSMSKKNEELLFRARGSRAADELYGLLDLVDDAPTGARTVGGFAQASFSWWQNTQAASTGVAATCGRKDMQGLFYDLEDVESAPNVILVHKDFYEVYEDDLLEMKMIVNDKFADAGFSNLVFKGVPMVKSPQATNTRLHMLNADYLYLVIDPAMNFEMTQWKEHKAQPFNRVAQIVVAQQLICTNRKAQAVLTGITY